MRFRSVLCTFIAVLLLLPAQGSQTQKSLQTTAIGVAKAEKEQGSCLSGFPIFKELSKHVTCLSSALLTLIAEYYGSGTHVYRILPILNPYDKSYTRSDVMPRAYLIEVKEQRSPIDGSLVTIPAFYPAYFPTYNEWAVDDLPAYWNHDHIANYIATEKILERPFQKSRLVREYDGLREGTEGVTRRALFVLSDMMLCNVVKADSVIVQRGREQSTLILVDTTYSQFFQAWKNMALLLQQEQECVVGSGTLKAGHLMSSDERYGASIIKWYTRYKRIFETLICEKTESYVPVFWPAGSPLSLESYSAIQPTPWEPTPWEPTPWPDEMIGGAKISD